MLKVSERRATPRAGMPRRPNARLVSTGRLNPDVKLVKAVEAEDKLTLLAGLGNLVKAYRKRPNIVARRGLNDETLETLQLDAEAAAPTPAARRRPPSASRRPATARRSWDAIRHGSRRRPGPPRARGPLRRVLSGKQRGAEQSCHGQVLLSLPR